jgi:hypothetical protein
MMLYRNIITFLIMFVDKIVIDFHQSRMGGLFLVTVFSTFVVSRELFTGVRSQIIDRRGRFLGWFLSGPAPFLVPRPFDPFFSRAPFIDLALFIKGVGKMTISIVRTESKVYLL